MIFGLYGKFIGDKGRYHQAEFPLAGKGGMFVGGGLHPGIVHEILHLRKVLRKIIGFLDQCVKLVYKAVAPHILLVINLLKRYGTAYHFVQKVFVEGDADALAGMTVPVPLCGVVPVFGEAGGIGGIMEFLPQLLLEKGLSLSHIIHFPVPAQPVRDGLAEAFHKQTHFRGVIHVQNIVETQLRTADDAVKGGKVRIMIQHNLPP